MPPSVALEFLYLGNTICSIPVFALVLFAQELGENTKQNDLLNTLDIAPDHVLKDNAPKNCDVYIKYIQQVIPWDMLVPHLSCPVYLEDAIGQMWSRSSMEDGFFSIQFQQKEIPDKIYRYMPFHPDRIHELLVDGKLFMPCPAMFNDPFDCSLDESMRLSFIESAIGCFSVVPNDVLMFSHYADNHKGLCVGFDTRQLITSLETKTSSVRADLRPVWYFSKMPKLNLLTQPALCATCKDDIWKYENEFRIFLSKGAKLEPSGIFAFDRAAIVEIICGCKATDHTLAKCKSLTNDLLSCKQKKALQLPNQFGVQLHEIH